MTLRIELPAGTDYVPVPEVLRLIALALHPDDRTGEPVQVSQIFKRSRLTGEDGRRGDRDADPFIPFAKNEATGEDDFALLRNIWAREGLPSIELPEPKPGMTPEEFEPYRRAVLEHGPKEWELDFSTRTPAFQVRLLRQLEVSHHGESLRIALMRGDVVACGPSRIPLRGAANVEDKSLFLSVDQFANYVRQYAMEVVQATGEYAGAKEQPEKARPDSPATEERWSLKPLTRADDLRRALHTHLAAADKTAAPPTASDVLSAWMASKPSGVMRVTANEVTYLDATGEEKAASLESVSERIQRCIERVGKTDGTLTAR